MSQQLPLDASRDPKESGFTLLEVLLAMTIVAVLITAVLQVFNASLLAREEVKALAEPMSKGPQILDMIGEDMRALWTYDIADNRVFRGEDRDIVGTPADRIHMLVAGQSVFPVRLDDDSMRHAPYAEVSYVLRSNDENPHHLELWRREDPLFDKELWRGGNYQLLSKRVVNFEVTYFEELGEEAEPYEEWDSAEKKTLPRRVKIEFEIERSADSHNALVEVDEIGGRTEKYVRHIVFDGDRVNLLNQGIALIPVVPAAAPEAENALAGGGAAAGAGGGRGGRGGAGGRGGDAGGRGGAGRGGKAGTTFTSGGLPGAGRGALDRIIKGVGGSGGRTNLGGLGGLGGKR